MVHSEKSIFNPLIYVQVQKFEVINMKNSQSGYIALTSMLLISAVIIMSIIGVTYSSIGEAQSGLALLKSEDNLQLVEGCIEDALLKIRSNSAFGQPTGTPVTITRPEGTCSITVNSIVGLVWTVTATSSSTGYKRTLRVIITRNPTGIVLTSWLEI